MLGQLFTYEMSSWISLSEWFEVLGADMSCFNDLIEEWKRSESEIAACWKTAFTRGPASTEASTTQPDGKSTPS